MCINENIKPLFQHMRYIFRMNKVYHYPLNFTLIFTSASSFIVIKSFHSFMYIKYEKYIWTKIHGHMHLYTYK